MMNSFLKTGLKGAALCAGLGLMAAPAMAAGQPEPWQMGLQEPVTQIAREINEFHHFLLVVITITSLFVLGLLIYVVRNFNEKANPIPSKTSHNTTLEVIWTVVPILLLLVIAVPSFRLLYKQYDFPKADVVIKAIGNQWYWSYEYPESEIEFDSVMVEKGELKKGETYLLETDNDVVVPVNKNVEILLTAADVLHNWTIPAFGVKVDAVPGRVLKVWFRAEKEGVYYGQCSELCGVRHAFMPITVRVVSEDAYATWLEKAKEEFASNDTPAKQGQSIRTVALSPAAAGKAAD